MSTETLIVCLNKPQGSVSYVMQHPEEIDNYHFLPERMELVEMPVIHSSYDTEDYLDYFVVDGKWVHADLIDPSSIHPDQPVRLLK